DVYDRAGPLMSHRRDHGANTVENPQEINTPHLFEVTVQICVQVREQIAMVNHRRVVNQNVETAKPLDCLLDHRMHCGAVGHIRLNRQCLSSRRPDALDDLPSSGTVTHKVNRYAASLMRQALRDGSPDTSRGPGYQGYSTKKSLALYQAVFCVLHRCPRLGPLGGHEVHKPIKFASWVSLGRGTASAVPLKLGRARALAPEGLHRLTVVQHLSG